MKEGESRLILYQRTARRSKDIALVTYCASTLETEIKCLQRPRKRPSFSSDFGSKTKRNIGQNCPQSKRQPKRFAKRYSAMVRSVGCASVRGIGIRTAECRGVLFPSAAASVLLLHYRSYIPIITTGFEVTSSSMISEHHRSRKSQALSSPNRRR